MCAINRFDFQILFDPTKKELDFPAFLVETGKTKGFKQIQNAPKGFVVKDDIEQGYLNIIPLWHFGLLH